MKMFCRKCGTEFEGNFCPDCGEPSDPVKENMQAPPTPSTIAPPVKKKKGRGCLIAALAIFIIPAFIGALANLATGKSVVTNEPITVNKEDNISIVEDMTQYSGISAEDLISKLGDPVSNDKWTNKTSKGNFEVETYSYDVNSNHYEFIIADNAVVRLSIYSDQNWNGKGNLFSYEDKKLIPKMFGVEVSKKSRTKDTNSAYVISQVSDSISTFNVQDMNSKDKTFGFVKVTYNPNYFD